MSSQTFRYKNLGVDGVTGLTVLRPIIAVEVVKKRKSTNLEVLLDSGADFFIFRGEIADLLGIDIESGTQHNITGVGGSGTKGFIHKIGLTIPGMQGYGTWGFFSNDLNDMNAGILGQIGFFEKYKVSFEYKKRLIVVRNK